MFAAQIPIAEHAARPTESTSRDFVPWRFSNAGLRSAWIARRCRRPTRLNTSGVFVFPAALPGTPLDVAAETYGVSTKWTGTATTSIGIARDRWMLYSKAGVAWARHEYTLGVNGFATALGGPFAFGVPTTTDTRVGWTVGTGVKWALADNWFLNVEYDYMDFGSKAQNFATTCVSPAAAGCGLGAPVGAVFSPTFNQNISEVKAGLNYKFPGGSLFFW